MGHAVSDGELVRCILSLGLVDPTLVRLTLLETAFGASTSNACSQVVAPSLSERRGVPGDCLRCRSPLVPVTAVCTSPSRTSLVFSSDVILSLGIRGSAPLCCDFDTFTGGTDLLAELECPKTLCMAGFPFLPLSEVQVGTRETRVRR